MNFKIDLKHYSLESFPSRTMATREITYTTSREWNYRASGTIVDVARRQGWRNGRYIILQKRQTRRADRLVKQWYPRRRSRIFVICFDHYCCRNVDAHFNDQGCIFAVLSHVHSVTKTVPESANVFKPRAATATAISPTAQVPCQRVAMTRYKTVQDRMGKTLEFVEETLQNIFSCFIVSDWTSQCSYPWRRSRILFWSLLLPKCWCLL